MPVYVKILKNIVLKKRSTGRFATVALTQEYNTIIPPRMRDPSSFTVPCSIEEIYIGQALYDLGVSINLMPLSIFKRLYVGQLTPTMLTLELADRSLVHLQGKLKDVLVTIDKFILPVDFIILYYKVDKVVPIILGRPFLSTGRAQIDVHKGEMTMSVNGKKLMFNIIKEMKFPNEDGLSDSDDEQTCVGNWESEEDNEEREDAIASIETFHAITKMLKNDEMLNLDEERKAYKPSLEQPPTQKLKTLPTHLKIRITASSFSLLSDAEMMTGGSSKDCLMRCDVRSDNLSGSKLDSA
ncbi:uncharacterized protein LOC120090587 [Benincasa hispida]|uniref:uncharacterized protein LOC120090587 n=1 Tax=Benincasa hispida TaxID=102211 RepID=UPI0019018E79|nr:uncharacterized protein LOC120090587 [Benincasa hispida]